MIIDRTDILWTVNIECLSRPLKRFEVCTPVQIEFDADKNTRQAEFDDQQMEPAQ